MAVPFWVARGSTARRRYPSLHGTLEVDVATRRIRELSRIATHDSCAC